MDQNTVVTFEKAMDEVSESILNFARFTEGLDKFLKLHKLGMAAFETEQDYHEFSDRGYDIGRFYLCDTKEKDLVYLDLHTNGSAVGENLGAERRGGIDCTWNEAMREILNAVGILEHSAVSREKIDKIIEMFG